MAHLAARRAPGYDRFGLTVTPAGEPTVWLDDPDNHWSPQPHTR
ncbi:hypothetical protein AB0D08_27950 [Kitasatospora sp. NPDC048540]